ncbi:MAG TPA: AGE family epimerase/isomerase [Clostridia bacterium]
MQELSTIRNRIHKELVENILPFWEKHMVDSEFGGFYGCAANDLSIEKTADKSCILNSHVLWTFSAAYSALNDENYLKTAEHAYRFLKDAFYDNTYGGLYFTVDYKGCPADRRKKIYAIASGINGLSEFYRATGNNESVSMAVDLYEIIEKNSFDNTYGGYFSAFSEDWKTIDDMKLCSKDLKAVKSANTHLHILDACINLYGAYPGSLPKEKLTGLVRLIIEKMYDECSGQLKLFFTGNWEQVSDIVSFGQSIAASRLIYKAAGISDDEELMDLAGNVSLKMAEAVYDQGYDEVLGGIYNQRSSPHNIDFDKNWWAQAEAASGFLNAYMFSGDKKYSDAILKTWEFIDKYIVDHQNGEWFNTVTRIGNPKMDLPKAETWKSPYSSSRFCLEYLSAVR